MQKAPAHTGGLFIAASPKQTRQRVCGGLDARRKRIWFQIDSASSPEITGKPKATPTAA